MPPAPPPQPAQIALPKQPDRDVAGIRRIRDYLTSALEAMEDVGERGIYLLHVPAHETPVVTQYADHESLALAVAARRGDGHAWAFYGELWPIRLQPFLHIQTPRERIVVPQPGIGSAPDGALSPADPPPQLPVVEEPVAVADTPLTGEPDEYSGVGHIGIAADADTDDDDLDE